jgi:hypothetical protein
MSSIPRFDAASISITSSERPPAIVRQLSHSPHGSPEIPRSQFSALARMRAVVVLPLPRGPANRYAWAMRFWSRALRRVRVTCSWLITSPKAPGLYFSASGWWGISRRRLHGSGLERWKLYWL